MSRKHVARVAGRLSALAVNAAATVILLAFAVVGPYSAVVRVLCGVAACAAGVGAATGFVKLRKAVSAPDIANPS